MTQIEVMKEQETAIGRPLAVLVPLILSDIKHGQEAARSAGMPFYKAAGEKLIEAKAQMPQGEWRAWVRRNFSLSHSTATEWMRFARKTQNATDVAFSSLSEAVRKPAPPRVSSQPWHEPIKSTLKNVDADYLDRLKEKRLAEENERKLTRDLGLKLIDIGYKTLATKLHPDKGGSNEAMQRLHRVKKLLRAAL